MKFATFVLSICLVSASVGCDNGGTESVFNEDEMAQYRQTPEEMRAAMKEAQASSRAGKKQIAESAKTAGQEPAAAE
ncbi:hypothetical protein [Allorhodopirellula solitaria]|uniref:Secreted protein n=1 Tax=Allorhodopirellula solitaria TaxID=2527987 RepID=A0A5C5YIS7_9BACT|nr:hypothetical protein [Allorhodopirellula solitaria]TWT74775.1 hypothetical protein CA85_00600 [Allorhodopirellula solitaria]